MKKIFILNIGLILVLHTNAKNPSEWGGLSQGTFFTNWSVYANVGFTSYYGDLSMHDSDWIKKLNNESHTAFAIGLSHDLTEYLDVSGQILYGQLKSKHPSSQNFESSLLEYSLSATMDPLRLLIKNYDWDFGIVGFAGIGQFIFETKTIYQAEQSVSETIHSTGVPEFVYFVGGELYYNISGRIKVNATISLHQAQNDKLDNLKKNNNFDYYSFTGIGLTFALNNSHSANSNNSRAHQGMRLTQRR